MQGIIKGGMQADECNAKLSNSELGVVSWVSRCNSLLKPNQQALAYTKLTFQFNTFDSEIYQIKVCK